MKKKRGRPLTFTLKTEKRVVKLLQTSAALAWPLDREDIAKLFGNLVRTLKIKTQFRNGVPGKDFIRAFLKRHSLYVSLRKPELLKIAEQRPSTLML